MSMLYSTKQTMYYISAFLAGFMFLSLLLTEHPDKYTLLDVGTEIQINGIITSIDTENQEIQLLSYDLYQTEAPENYLITLRYDEESVFNKKDFIVEANTIIGQTETVTIDPMELNLNEIVFVDITENRLGYKIISLLVGSPYPAIHAVTPLLLTHLEAD